MEGSVFALARWFQPERYANRPEDDFLRDEILNDLYEADAVAIDGKVCLVRTPKGACSIEASSRYAGIVEFDYVSSERWERTSFWMNASSVAGLREVLATKPRVAFDALFVGAAV